MHYAPHDFTALSEAVVADGGICLPDPCEGREVPFKINNTWKRVWTANCGFAARMKIPYSPHAGVRLQDDEGKTVVDVGGEKQLAETAMATVCAVDDSVGLWPRYQHTISEDSYA